MQFQRAFAACLLLALAFGCGDRRASDTLMLRIRGSAERPLSPDAIRYVPADNVISARLSAQGWLAIERRDASRALTVEMPEWCLVTFAAGPQRAPIDARPVIDLGADRPPVGFDAQFVITAEHGCEEQRGRGRISWRQLEGAPISKLSVTPDGFVLRARTSRFETLHPEPLPPGIVAFSPRTQGRVVLEALWRAPGSPPIRRSVTILSTSRSTGLSSVAVSQQVLLSGAGWRVRKAPQGGHAQVHASGELSAFTPDAQGRWALERDDTTLVVQALWHDKTPYDCGRRECHASIAETTSQSRMSSALERPLSEPQPSAVGCMLDCHVLGERGLHDGGFLDVSAQLGFTWLASTSWQDLPQALRRLGGVRCTACHGPGALPEPDGRELVLRSDVCATCHDAPPRYVHVEQWRASRMARSDAAPNTRNGACAACHTTAGFLEQVAGRRAPKVSSAFDAEPVGIACAACHAPHDSHRGARLVRSMPDPSTLQDDAIPPDPRSELCMQCHMPAADEAQPSASSGALWQGRVRVPALAGGGWEEVRRASAHAAVPNGCVGCHGATPSGKVDHSFRVDAVTCKQCHAAGVSLQPSAVQDSLQARAWALVQSLDKTCTVTASAATAPGHATPGRVVCRDPRLTRAMYELNLVLEDPAAFVHNAALAWTLLEDAERLIAPH